MTYNRQNKIDDCSNHDWYFQAGLGDANIYAWAYCINCSATLYDLYGEAEYHIDLPVSIEFNIDDPNNMCFAIQPRSDIIE